MANVINTIYSLGKNVQRTINKSFFRINLLTVIILGIYLILTKNSEIGLWIIELSLIFFLVFFYIYIEKANKKTPPI
jgi:hypothetical protein